MRRTKTTHANPMRLIIGNMLFLGMLAGFMMIALAFVGWWFLTVYGLIGMKTFFGTASGTIESSKVVYHAGSSSRHGDTSPAWEVRLLYHYEVDGKAYRGYRYTPSFGGGFGAEAQAQRIVQGLPPGQRVPVRYDPLMPSQSALAASYGGAETGGLIFVPCFFLMGAAICVYNRRHWPSEPDPRPLAVRFRQWMTTAQTTPGASPWILMLAGVVFGGGGVVIMATAFTPREPSQISMGTAAQLCFGGVFLLLGLGACGFFLSCERRR